MKLISKVGKNCYGQKPRDVITVQAALGAIKKAGKAYYPRKIDGKCGVKTIDAIERFQSDECLVVTGQFQPGGPGMSRLRAKTPPQVKAQMQAAANVGTIAGAGISSTRKSDTELHRMVATESNKIDKMPFPRLEKSELKNIIMDTYHYYKVVLKYLKHGVGPEGRFFMHLDFGEGLPTTDPDKRETIKAVKGFISKTFKKWKVGGAGKIELKSALQLKSLIGGKDVSSKFLKAISYGNIPNDPILKKCLGACEKIASEVTYDKHAIKEELKILSDAGGTVDQKLKDIPFKMKDDRSWFEKNVQIPFFDGVKKLTGDNLNVVEESIQVALKHIHESVNQLNNWSESDKNKFEQYFKSRDEKYRQIVLKTLQAGYGFLKSSARSNFRHKNEAGPKAIVPANTLAFVIEGDNEHIYFTYLFFNDKLENRANTIVHEITHLKDPMVEVTHAFGETARDKVRHAKVYADYVMSN